MSNRANLWIIATDNGDCWCDDRGGSLFVSLEMAQRTYRLHQAEIGAYGAKIRESDLDDDLCQMGDLYHEKVIKLTGNPVEIPIEKGEEAA